MRDVHAGMFAEMNALGLDVLARCPVHGYVPAAECSDIDDPLSGAVVKHTGCAEAVEVVYRRPAEAAADEPVVVERAIPDCMVCMRPCLVPGGTRELSFRFEREPLPRCVWCLPAWAPDAWRSVGGPLVEVDGQPIQPLTP
jgi:hypothetical protein